MFGEGPDLVFCSGSFSHTDVIWEDPASALFFLRLGEFARVIRFDRRGSSNSDPMPPDGLQPWEAYNEELLAVIDAAGSARAVVVAALDAGPTSLLFAASNPGRVQGLIFYNTGACFVASDDYQIGLPRDVLIATIEMIADQWGSDWLVDVMVPLRAGDQRFRSWYAKLLRAIGTPNTVRTALQSFLELDARPFLQTITAPSLVMHRRDFPTIPIEIGRYLAEELGAPFVEIPGSDGTFYFETPEILLDHIAGFVGQVTEGGVSAPSERVLATMLFSDIVQSTALLGRVGDPKWARLLDVHDEVTRDVVEKQGGKIVKGTGDGMLAMFASPTAAVRSGIEIGQRLLAMGIEIRAGVHSGEVTMRDQDVSGVAVHIASRVMGEAEPGEVLVSRTVRDLVGGSGMPFEDRGLHDLKGVAEPWQLYRAALP